MNPDLLYYSKNHMWVSSVDEPIVRIGLTDYAQKQLKAVIFLNLPEIDECVVCGERLGDVESLKTVTDLISPVSGIVVSVNSELMDSPENINSDPYGSWMLEVKIDNILNGLMDLTEYQKYMEQL